jgi:hypothetical protein
MRERDGPFLQLVGDDRHATLVARDQEHLGRA